MKNTTTTTNTTTPGGNRGYNGIAAAVSARAALPVQPRFCGADDARSLRRRPPQHQAPTLPNRGPLPQAPAFPVDPAALAPPASPRMPDGTQYIDHCAPHAPRAQLLGAVAIYDALTGTRLPFRDSSGAPLPLAFIQQARVVNGHDVIRQAASAAQAPLDEIHAWVEIGGVSCRVLPYNYIDEVVLNPLTRRNEFGHVAVYVYREAPAGTRREVQGLCSGCHRAQEAIQMMRVTEQQLEWRELADAQDRVAANVQRGCTPAFVAKLRAWHGELTEACAVLVRSLRSTHCSCHGDGACDAGHPLHAEHWLDLYVRGLVPEPYAVGVAAEAGVTRAQDAARWHRLEQIGELPPLSGVVMLGVVPQRRTRRAPATANTSSPAATGSATGSATATDIVSSTTADTTPVAPPPSRAASLTAEDANNGGGDTEGAAASLAMEVASESDGDTSSSDGASEEPPAQQDAEDAEEAEAAVDDCSTDGAESDVGEPDEAAAHSVVEAVLSSVFGDEDDDGAPAASSASLVGGCSLPHAAEVQRLFCGHDDATAAPSTSRDESSGSATPNNRRPKAPAAAVFSESPAGSPTRENAAATMDAPGPVKERAAAAAPQAAPSKPTAPPTTAAAKRAAEKEKSRQRRAAQAAREAEAQAEKKAAKAKAAAARASKQAAREAEEDALLTKAAATTAAAASAASTTTASTTAAADESRNNSPMWFSRPAGFASLFFGGRSVGGLNTPSKLRSHFCTPSASFVQADDAHANDGSGRGRFFRSGSLLVPPAIPDFDYPGSHHFRGVATQCHYLCQLCSTCGSGDRRSKAVDDLVQSVHRMTAEAKEAPATYSPERLYGFASDCVLLSVLLTESVIALIPSSQRRARDTAEVLLTLAVKLLPFAAEYIGSPVFARQHRCHARPCTIAVVCLAMLRVTLGVQVGLLRSSEPLAVGAHIPDLHARWASVDMLLPRSQAVGRIVTALVMGHPLRDRRRGETYSAPRPLDSCFARGTRLDGGHRLLSLVAFVIVYSCPSVNGDDDLAVPCIQRLAADAGSAAIEPLERLIDLARAPLHSKQDLPRFGEGGPVAILVTAQQLTPTLFGVMARATRIVHFAEAAAAVAATPTAASSSVSSENDSEEDAAQGAQQHFWTNYDEAEADAADGVFPAAPFDPRFETATDPPTTESVMPT